MAEVLRLFEQPFFVDGQPYSVRAVGRQNGHLWEGWIEFVADAGDEARHTARETTQPDREALLYWASGLSATYVEGAAARAFADRRPRPVRTQAEAVFEAPATPRPPVVGADVAAARDRAVLDPFSVGAKGETLLRQELNALRAWHLRNIVRAYDLASADADLERLAEPELIELIVNAVVARAT